MPRQPLVGQGLIIEASRSQTPHSVGLLRTSDQPGAEISVRDNRQHTQETAMPPAGFELSVPASERP